MCRTSVSFWRAASGRRGPCGGLVDLALRLARPLAFASSSSFFHCYVTISDQHTQTTRYTHRYRSHGVWEANQVRPSTARRHVGRKPSPHLVGCLLHGPTNASLPPSLCLLSFHPTQAQRRVPFPANVWRVLSWGGAHGGGKKRR